MSQFRTFYLENFSLDQPPFRSPFVVVSRMPSQHGMCFCLPCLGQADAVSVAAEADFLRMAICNWKKFSLLLLLRRLKSYSRSFQSAEVTWPFRRWLSCENLRNVASWPGINRSNRALFNSMSRGACLQNKPDFVAIATRLVDYFPTSV